MYIALDLETTGLSAEKDKIIEIAAIKIDPDGTILEEYHSLVQPHVKLPKIIINLTGITDQELEGAPTIDDIRDDVIAFIGDAPILGHSVQFDIDFLEASGIETGKTVLDTFQLAQTLLPNETSYSLEVLSDKFGLTHESKHRADDDTKVAIELYKLLLEKIHEIPTDVTEKINPILQKTEWGWKDTFLENLPQKETSTPAPQQPIENPTSEGSTNLQKQLFEQLSKNENTIIEAPHGTAVDLAFAGAQFSEDSGEKCLIATPHPEHIQADARVAHLQHPIRYLCHAALDEFLNKESFENGEARLLIKVLIWLNTTKKGEKNEIVVGDDEQTAWNHVSAFAHLYKGDCGHKECFYSKALQTAKSIPVLVVSHHLLLENIARKGALIPERPHLLLDSIETLEESATNTLTQYFSAQTFLSYTTEPLTSRFEILFGLLGMFIEKHAKKDAFARQVILDPTLSSTPEWQKFKATADDIEKEIQNPLLKARFQAFQKAISMNPELLTWSMLSYQGDPILKSCPIQIRQLLKQELWDKKQTLLLLSAFGSLGGNFEFTKSRLNLPGDLPETVLQPEGQQTLIPFNLHAELPDAKSHKNLAPTTDLIQRISYNQNTFVLVNALSAIDQLHDRMATPLKEQEILVMAQGITGGMGKIGERFAKTPQTSLLIGNQNLFTRMMQGPSSSKIETLVIHRLPFLPPSHPVHEHECKRLQNGFSEYSLPMAVLRLKKFLHLFLTNAKPKEIHILDPRFEKYDGKFIQSLPKNLQLA